jgi:hypothetical protein
MLGLTSNFTTLAGLVLVWIYLSRGQWVEGFLETALTVLAFTPIFMGDAVDHYCLGRVRLEHLKGWDDIQITAKGRAQVAYNYHIFRVASIIPAYLLAAVYVGGFSAPAETVLKLKLAFLAAFILHFSRTTWFLQNCVAPRLPSYGGTRLAWRNLLAGLAFVAWFSYFWNKTDFPASKLSILGSGIFYFLLNGFLHPLPTRYSLLRPGKPSRREAFFSAEVLDDNQLAALKNYDEITAVSDKCRTELGFQKIANLRLPLLELPLFQAWGRVLSSEDGRIAMLLLDSEVGRGVHRSLISFRDDEIFITTDFGSPQAKFPDSVKYQNYEKNLSASELLQQHSRLISEARVDNVKASICPKLENFVKNMIKFLETDAAAKRSRSLKSAEDSQEKVDEPDKQK